MLLFNGSYGPAQGLTGYFETGHDRYGQKIEAGRHNEDNDTKKYAFSNLHIPFSIA
jgi:hypothetical protein